MTVETTDTPLVLAGVTGFGLHDPLVSTAGPAGVPGVHEHDVLFVHAAPQLSTPAPPPHAPEQVPLDVQARGHAGYGPGLPFRQLGGAGVHVGKSDAPFEHEKELLI